MMVWCWCCKCCWSQWYGDDDNVIHCDDNNDDEKDQSDDGKADDDNDGSDDDYNHQDHSKYWVYSTHLFFDINLWGNSDQFHDILNKNRYMLNDPQFTLKMTGKNT